MEGVGVEDTPQWFTVDFRILSEKKKSSYRTARVKGFPVTDFRKEVQNILPGKKYMHCFCFGFIDKKQKIWVVFYSDLPDTYAAAISGQALWVAPRHSVVMDEVTTNKDQRTNKRKYWLQKWNVLEFLNVRLCIKFLIKCSDRYSWWDEYPLFLNHGENRRLHSQPERETWRKRSPIISVQTLGRNAGRNWLIWKYRHSAMFWFRLIVNK